ncbi:UBN2_3 domain-containing protein, partial [Cephalotus follicularis]
SPLNHVRHFLSIKLSATNYLLWRTQLVPFLRGQKLLDYAYGTTPCPSPTITITGYDDPQPKTAASHWKDQDQLLLSLLISSFSETVIPLVVGLNTSHEVWSTLDSVFASPSNTRILNLHMQLQRAQEPEKSATSFLQRLKRHADELSAVGRPIPLVDFNIYVFKDLKSEYKDLVTTLSTHSNPTTYS